MKEGWEYKNLGEVADFFRGLTYGKQDETQISNVCVLRSNNIDLESMSLNFDELKYLRSDFSIPSEKKLKANSIFICMSNGSKQHVGKVAFVSKDYDYAFGGFMGLIKPKKTMNAKYTYYACRSSLFKHFLLGVGNGIGITNLRFADLFKFNFPVPPISEQQRIVEELDLLSSIIEKKKEQLKELDNLAQSIFYDMFGDPVTNEKGWEDENMNSLCIITSSKRIFANEYCEEGVPFYRGKEITELSKGQPISTELNISQKRYEEIKKEFGVPSVGDILITAVGTIGNIWVVSDDRPFYFKDGNIIWLKDIKGFDSVFFRRLLAIQIDAFKNEMAQGCAYNALTIVNLKKMKALCPPLSLQQQFASKIEAIEKQKELIKQSIKEVETLFNSRMDYYFT